MQRSRLQNHEQRRKDATDAQSATLASTDDWSHLKKGWGKPVKGNRWLEKTIEYIKIQWGGLCKASHPLDLVNLSERFCQETIPLLILRILKK